MGIERIKIENISPNTHQFRKIFDDGSLEKLAHSFQGGQPIMPIVVYPYGDGYTIIVGERRWRAAKKAGLKSLDCIVRSDLKGKEPDDPDILELSAFENIQREDLTPIEKGEMYTEYRQRTGLSQGGLAKKWGINPMDVSRHESLLKLSPNIMLGLETGMLDKSICFGLARIDDKDKQDKVLQAMTEHRMVNESTANIIALPANLAAADSDFKQIVKDYGRMSKTTGKKKTEPTPDIYSEKFIDDIVSFYQIIKEVDLGQLPSNKHKRISSELSQLYSAINRLCTRFENDFSPKDTLQLNRRSTTNIKLVKDIAYKFDVNPQTVAA